MITNESTLDRGIRAVIGIAAIIGAFVVGLGSVLGIVLVVVGAVLALTAATGFCPLYRMLGIAASRVPQDR
jgi:hypothetical protein